MAKLKFIILPRYKLPQAKTFYDCDHVISVFEKTDKGDPTPEGVDPINHKKYFFDDIWGEAIDKLRGPGEEDIKTILSMYPTKLPDEKDSKIFLHCFAGVSRSPAIAYMLHCKEYGPGREQEAIERTAMEAPYQGIHPNPTMVALADKILEREGKMIEALQNWLDEEYPKI